MQALDLASVAQLLRALAPESVWLLKHIESEDGYVRFPVVFVEVIQNLNIENYPELYESERLIGAMMIRAFFEPAEVEELESDFAAMSEVERGAAFRELTGAIEGVADGLAIPKTQREKQLAREAFEALSEDEQKAATIFWRRFMMAFLAGFHQVLSLMVHGEKLTSLVAQAKAGDDKAYAKAVQIDKRIMSRIPYFQARLATADTLGDRSFTEMVGAHLQRPPYKGKIRHKTLYLAFAVLDMCGLLETMKHREILDLCDEAGMGGYPSRIEDVKNLSKRLKEYRAFQRRGMDLSTP
jgi:hypothetical protein